MDKNNELKGWKLYFPLEEKSMNELNTQQNIRAIQHYIKRNDNLFSYTKIDESHCFTVDYTLLMKDEILLTEWLNFQDELNTNTEYVLNCMSCAMYDTITEELNFDNLTVLRARLMNHYPVLNLNNLEVTYYNKLMSLRGTIIRIGNTKLLSRWMSFQCCSCYNTQIVQQPDGIFTQPNRCPTKGCRAKGKFVPQHSSPQTKTVDFQMMKLQELIGTNECNGGRVPRTIECELTDDLVESCSPGDDVTVTGVIKVRTSEETGPNNKSNQKKQAPVLELYMDAISIVNNRMQSANNKNNGIEFNVQDYYAIQKIHSDENLFRLLVHSVCPTIYGHEMVKAGLLLGLFSGGAKGTEDANSKMMRTESHVLIVGDPGLGKSQMLQACANVAPRGIFVCGNASTTSGLTVTMIRESGGEYSLEAGALVLADQGCCCIDEFDKMTTQHAALLESMEQQSVSIAKAGVVCTLQARTSILAAANPAGGHYNRAKTVSENLRIGSALLSRFDLVFILRDKADKTLDDLLSKHVLALHTSRDSKLRNVTSFPPLSSVSTSSLTSADRSIPALNTSLQLIQDEKLSTLPHSLLRKYIAYARQYVHPTLSPEAASILKEFFLHMRKTTQTHDVIPVTVRQAQSLARLTLARAKIELREIATEQDALDVIDIMKYSLIDTLCDENNTLDFKRSQHGSGMSQRGRVKKFVALLQRKAEMECRAIFTKTELKDVAANNGIVGEDFYNLLTTLNIHGFLLKKDSEHYKLLSADT